MIKNLAIAVALALSPVGAIKGKKAQTSYYNHDVCGTVKHYFLPPITYAKGDIDGDGKNEHFYAYWKGIERLKMENSFLTLDERFYEDELTEPYTCADLRLKDLDGDKDLDMVYLSTREVRVYKNNKGKMELETEISLYYDNDVDPRIKFSKKHGQVQIEIDESRRTKIKQ